MATFCSLHRVQMHFKTDFGPSFQVHLFPAPLGMVAPFPPGTLLPPLPGDGSWFFPFPLKCPVLHSLVKLSLQDSISHVTLGLPLLRHTLADAGSCLPAGYPGIPAEHLWVCGLNLLR